MNYYNFQFYQLLIIMSQVLDYIASVFTNKTVANSNKDKSHNHVTFTENSFTYALGGKNDADKANKLLSLGQSNRKTIYTFMFIGALAFLLHLYLVTVPKVQSETFDLLAPDGWQLVTLTLVPLIIYAASIGAMNEINQPLEEGTKLTSKNSGLDLNNNDFIHSLKVIIVLMAVGQVVSIFYDQVIWSSVIIVSILSSDGH